MNANSLSCGDTHTPALGDTQTPGIGDINTPVFGHMEMGIMEMEEGNRYPEPSAIQFVGGALSEGQREVALQEYACPARRPSA